MIVEEVRDDGPADAAPDLQRVLAASRNLNVLVDGLMNGKVAAPADAESEARLRHDLRTPMNAILGYSEMVVDDFAEVLSPGLTSDIDTVVRESRALLDQIDRIVDFAHAGSTQLLDANAEFDADHTIATRLADVIAAPAAGPERETGRILVVDDVKSNRDLLARRLRRDGHAVVTAPSAAAALEVLARGAVDLALIDILMPDVNGIELLAQMKADGATRDVPVLMVTGLKEEAAVLRCIAAGAEDYLPKPVDTVLLRARISACLERRRWREREKEYLGAIKAERDRANTLLHAILPGSVVQRLDGGEQVIADRFDSATIIFTDIVGFTKLAAEMTPSELVRKLGLLFSQFDHLSEKHGVEKIKTIGDAYMAASGLPEPRPDHAAAAVAFARELVAESGRADWPNPPLRIRVGVHSGPVIAGLIGKKRFIYDVWGHTVNMAARLEAHSEPGRVHISQSTLTALGGGVAVEPQGKIDLKGIGLVSTFLVSE